MTTPSTFKHLVSKSTLAQGIAVRKDCEEWFNAPAKGQSREIVLLFEGQEALVTLRRLANESGSVQMRYEARRHSPFREWLRVTFTSPESPAGCGLLEFHKAGDDAYRVVPILGEDLAALTLCLGPGLSHNSADDVAQSCSSFPDILKVVGSIRFHPGQGQAYYNQQIKDHFVERGWQSDQPVIPELPLRFDFRKSDCQVEVEFGNARSYYQDYLKFLVPFTRGIIRLGVLLVPTADFARLLCAGGTQRAIDRAQRAGTQLDRTPKYSGMITYEKVEREFEALRFILNMPIAVSGIDFWGRRDTSV